jgi:tRNA threonylcarbamoyladenosine biosynthesis protein TsaB
MILFIDTTDFKKVTFCVGQNKKIIKRSYILDAHRSYETLIKLDEFLKRLKIFPKAKYSEEWNASSLKKIIVNKGPGSYTGVRVGVTIAMAFGLALEIPVSSLAAADYARTLMRFGNR